MKWKISRALSKFWDRPLLPVNNSMALLAARFESWAPNAFLRSNLLYFLAKRYQRLFHFWSISAAPRSGDDVLIPRTRSCWGLQRRDTYRCIKMSPLNIKMYFVWMWILKSNFSTFSPPPQMIKMLQRNNKCREICSPLLQSCSCLWCGM